MSKHRSVSKIKKIRERRGNHKVGGYYRNVITDDIVRVLKVNYLHDTLVFRYVGFKYYDDGTRPIHSSDFKFFDHYFKPYPIIKGVLVDITKGKRCI